jgi:hypothetical protein
MKFREHRGGLDESLRTCVEIADRPALVMYIRELLSRYYFVFQPDQLHVEPYANDARIGWPNTHVVTIDGYGVVGFTDGPAT